ncbi:hypothetical protein GCM10010914_20790 [Deinococcus wulumuqiensis]|uniref:Uncharacterized protein n=1 Tax=Deinococcus wulumuqiensis TaxID=980427 RepID=A0AAV4K6R1_9DEIO|nr:hypothetical protein GCM10010914_20790 [Deinococcus wulumuqiensis]GGP30962.1 hypothetical protein GCM10008021_26130 [Deinococcus wulumuqiensis]
MRRAIPIRTSGSTQPQTLEAGGTAADAGQGQETQTGQNRQATSKVEPYLVPRKVGFHDLWI